LNEDPAERTFAFEINQHTAEIASILSNDEAFRILHHKIGITQVYQVT
jgi:hypothetical protein